MRYFTLSLLLLAVSAKVIEFDSLHASCQIDFAVKGKCRQLQQRIYNATLAFQVKPKKYFPVETSFDEGFSHVTRTHPLPFDQKFVDDITFEFKQSDEGFCEVEARSASRSYSFYDFYQNHCNISILLENEIIEWEKVSHCRFANESINVAGRTCKK